MISRSAFFDELVKIGEEKLEQQKPAKKKSLTHALKAMGVGAAGLGLGYGAAELIARNTKFFHEPNEGRATAAKVILPILAGTTAMLAERYRSKMTDQYSKVKGYKDPRNKSF